MKKVVTIVLMLGLIIFGVGAGFNSVSAEHDEEKGFPDVMIPKR